MKNPMSSVATNAPVSTVHYMDSAVGTCIEELSAAASANTLAFAGISYHASSLQTLKWTIHNFVKFITTKKT
jgi:hypothetical protein